VERVLEVGPQALATEACPAVIPIETVKDAEKGDETLSLGRDEALQLGVQSADVVLVQGAPPGDRATPVQ